MILLKYMYHKPEEVSFHICQTFCQINSVVSLVETKHVKLRFIDFDIFAKFPKYLGKYCYIPIRANFSLTASQKLANFHNLCRRPWRFTRVTTDKCFIEIIFISIHTGPFCYWSVSCRDPKPFVVKDVVFLKFFCGAFPFFKLKIVSYVLQI